MALRYSVVLFAALLISPGVPRADAQEKTSRASHDDGERLPTLYYFTHVEPRKKLIEEELRAGPREAWEGSFCRYGLHGPSPGWLISRKAGYVSLSRVLDLGTVEVKGTRIALNSESPAKPWGLERPVYEVVRWGQRMYLVEPDRLVAFCNEANSGELRSAEKYLGSFLLRDGDEKKKVTELPEVPDEFKRYLLEKPITGAVTSQLGEKGDVAVRGEFGLFGGFSVGLNVGKWDGVQAGMRFYFGGEDDRQVGYVISVTQGRCELLVQSVSDPSVKAVQPGARWATTDPFYGGK